MNFKSKQNDEVKSQTIIILRQQHQYKNLQLQILHILNPLLPKWRKAFFSFSIWQKIIKLEQNYTLWFYMKRNVPVVLYVAPIFRKDLWILTTSISMETQSLPNWL